MNNYTSTLFTFQRLLYLIKNQWLKDHFNILKMVPPNGDHFTLPDSKPMRAPNILEMSSAFLD